MSKHDLVDRQVSEGRDLLCKFLLWERQFRSYGLDLELNWRSIRALRDNASALPQSQGVYAFVVKPSVANLHWAGYILYVGKTEDQTFRERFPQYFAEQKREKPRLWVRRMFKFWPNCLYYYFAETAANDADRAEEELLKALVPPNNERFPGRLAVIKKEIYR